MSVPSGTSLVSCRTHPPQPPGGAAPTFRRQRSWQDRTDGPADSRGRRTNRAFRAVYVADHVPGADRSGIPPGRSPFPAVRSRTPRSVRLRTGRGRYLSVRRMSPDNRAGGRGLESLRPHQAHRPRAGLPSMAMLTAQPGYARRGRSRWQDLAGDHLADHPGDAHIGARIRLDSARRHHGEPPGGQYHSRL